MANSVMMIALLLVCSKMDILRYLPTPNEIVKLISTLLSYTGSNQMALNEANQRSNEANQRSDTKTYFHRPSNQSNYLKNHAIIKGTRSCKEIVAFKITIQFSSWVALFYVTKLFYNIARQLMIGRNYSQILVALVHQYRGSPFLGR